MAPVFPTVLCIRQSAATRPINSGWACKRSRDRQGFLAPEQPRYRAVSKPDATRASERRLSIFWENRSKREGFRSGPPQVHITSEAAPGLGARAGYLEKLFQTYMMHTAQSNRSTTSNAPRGAHSIAQIKCCASPSSRPDQRFSIEFNHFRPDWKNFSSLHRARWLVLH